MGDHRRADGAGQHEHGEDVTNTQVWILLVEVAIIAVYALKGIIR